MLSGDPMFWHRAVRIIGSPPCAVNGTDAEGKESDWFPAAVSKRYGIREQIAHVHLPSIRSLHEALGDSEERFVKLPVGPSQEIKHWNILL